MGGMVRRPTCVAIPRCPAGLTSAAPVVAPAPRGRVGEGGSGPPRVVPDLRRGRRPRRPRRLARRRRGRSGRSSRPACAQLLDAPGHPVEDAGEALGVVGHRVVVLGRGCRLLASAHVVAIADVVVGAGLHPLHELFDPAHRHGVGQVELRPEAGVAREEVVLVLVLGRLLQKGLEAHARHRAAGQRHEHPAGLERVGHHQRGGPVRRQLGRPGPSSRARYMARTGRPSSSERGSAPWRNWLSSSSAVV